MLASSRGVAPPPFNGADLDGASNRLEEIGRSQSIIYFVVFVVVLG